jgi:hypothetical protein
MKKEFPNQVYSIQVPVETVDTATLRSEIKALRHAWVIQLKLNHKKAHESLMVCIKQIESELKRRVCP